MSPVSKEDFIAVANTGRTLNLSISDCILMSLKNNSEIRIESFNPKIKEEDINSAWAEFEPIFNVDYLLHDKTEKANNSLLGADVSTIRAYTLDAGVSGKLITGDLLPETWQPLGVTMNGRRFACVYLDNYVFCAHTLCYF